MSNVLDCLQEAVIYDLVAASQNLTWAPVIDGVEILEDVQISAMKGKFSNRGPVVLGTNLDEATIFMLKNPAFPPTMNATVYFGGVKSFFGNLTGDVLKLYPLSNYLSNQNQKVKKNKIRKKIFTFFF